MGHILGRLTRLGSRNGVILHFLSLGDPFRRSASFERPLRHRIGISLILGRLTRFYPFGELLTSI